MFLYSLLHVLIKHSVFKTLYTNFVFSVSKLKYHLNFERNSGTGQIWEHFSSQAMYLRIITVYMPNVKCGIHIDSGKLFYEVDGKQCDPKYVGPEVSHSWSLMFAYSVYVVL